MNRSEKHSVARRTLLAGTAAAGAGLAWGAAGPAAARGRGAESGQLSQRAVDAEVARRTADLIALRRDLHSHPEPPGQEQRTAGVVARELRAAGLAVRTGIGGHGVIGVLRGARPGRTVAYRADMDAVPPKDIIGGGTEPAHLCGHDLHTTMGIGIAQVLARLRRELSGTVVFVFQPAEEALSGAEAVLKSGVLQRLGVSEIHALHCGPFPVGQFATTAGYGMPGQDKAELTVTGPDAAQEAQRLAAELGALATVPMPKGDADLERIVADSLVPNGPLATFVSLQARAREATVGVSYRCWPQERYAEVREDIRRTAARYPGAQVRFPGDPFPALVCPEREGRALVRHLRHTLGRSAVTPLHTAFPPFSGEDFALYLSHVPGTFTYLGVRTPGTPITASYPHFTTFVPDERAIALGVRTMSTWLGRRSCGG